MSNVGEKVRRLGIPCWDAFAEVAFTLFVSNLALLLTVFMHVVDTKDAVFDLDTAAKVVYSGVRPQEILVYVLAISAAPLWIMVARWKARRHAALFFWMGGLHFIMISGSAFIFARARSGPIANIEFAEGWAVTCFVVSIAIWFLTLLYRSLILDAVSETMATPSSRGDNGQPIEIQLREPS